MTRRACRLAVEANLTGHEAFNICAPTTIMDTPTRELVQRYLPQVEKVRDDVRKRTGAATIQRRQWRFWASGRAICLNGTLQ